MGLEAGLAIYEDSYLDGAHLRVLSVPLKLGKRIIGTLQVGASLSVVDATQGNLISMMAIIAVVAVLMAGFGSWVVLGRALSSRSNHRNRRPDDRADDLSRRIPYQQEQTEDEIGDLVVSFNQTLERLESLFTSQQRFLADVSHELRTPLTVIKGNVDLMRRMKQADEEYLSSIDQKRAGSRGLYIC
jgi:signal transduction histidine kinase